MDKQAFAEAAKKLNLTFNSLQKDQEIALVALLIEEESGIDLKEAFAIASMLVEWVGSNNSALRQKINRIVFDKDTPKGQQASASNQAWELLQKAGQ